MEQVYKGGCDFKGVIPNVDRADRRNNEQGRIRRLLDANCGGRLSLRLLANQTIEYVCVYASPTQTARVA